MEWARKPRPLPHIMTILRVLVFVWLCGLSGALQCHQCGDSEQETCQLPAPTYATQVTCPGHRDQCYSVKREDRDTGIVYWSRGCDANCSQKVISTREETGAIICCSADACNSGSRLDEGDVTCFRCGSPNQPPCEEHVSRNSNVVGCHGKCYMEKSLSSWGEVYTRGCDKHCYDSDVVLGEYRTIKNCCTKSMCNGGEPAPIKQNTDGRNGAGTTDNSSPSIGSGPLLLTCAWIILCLLRVIHV